MERGFLERKIAACDWENKNSTAGVALD
jgi:hypothetical protein